MSTPPPPPTGDAPLPPAGDALPASQMQPMQMSGAPAKSGKGKLIGIIAGVLIVVVALVFAGITLWGDPFATPDGTVKYVLNGLADNKPEVLWEAMPASYKQTLNDELKKSMANVDPEVHKQTFVVLQKLTGLLKNKKTLILEAANSSAQQSGAEEGDVIPPEVTENWDGGVSLLEIVVNSKLSDTAWVQNPDLGVLLKEDVGKLMSSPVLEILVNKALAEDGNPDAPEDMAQLRKWIKGIEVTVVSSEETTAKVKLSSTDFKIPEGEGELDMVKVEERWLPKEVAMGLDQVIAQLKQAVPMGSLADTKMTAQQKEVTLNFLKTVDGVLDAIDKQETAENMMQAAMGGLGGLALQFGQLQGAFPNMGIAGGNPGSFPDGNPGGVTGTSTLPGLPPPSKLPAGRQINWTINGGKKRIDQIYLSQSEATIQKAFGEPDDKEGAYWIYNNMTVRNIAGGGTMTKVYFGIQNGVVVDIQARP